MKIKKIWSHICENDYVFATNYKMVQDGKKKRNMMLFVYDNNFRWNI